MRTVADILKTLPKPQCEPLPAPPYTGTAPSPCVGLAVESMKRHMTDEGWQLFAGLESAEYTLAGKDLITKSTAGDRWVQKRPGMTNVPEIIDFVRPGVLVLQDKREWEGLTADRSRDPSMRFTDVGALKQRTDIFKLTVLKDAQHATGYHRESADEIGCHAWVCYYHPQVVCHLAPYVRPEHVVRVYHTVDTAAVPVYTEERRQGCLLSGATSNVYPLRTRLVRQLRHLPATTLLRHPGYHRNGCATPDFLRTLSRHKVAICTASIYGYALRKIIEATACGCVVVTDLPHDEILPAIDGNLVRIHPLSDATDVARLLRRLYDEYDPVRQREFAVRACSYYDFRTAGWRLAADIECLRQVYKS